jgi:hypothetical protein
LWEYEEATYGVWKELKEGKGGEQGRDGRDDQTQVGRGKGGSCDGQRKEEKRWLAVENLGLRLPLHLTTLHSE